MPARSLWPVSDSRSAPKSDYIRSHPCFTASVLPARSLIREAFRRGVTAQQTPLTARKTSFLNCVSSEAKKPAPTRSRKLHVLCASCPFAFSPLNHLATSSELIMAVRAYAAVSRCISAAIALVERLGAAAAVACTPKHITLALGTCVAVSIASLFSIVTSKSCVSVFR